MANDPSMFLNRVRIPEGQVGSYRIKHIIDKPGASRPTANLRNAFFGGHDGEPVVFPDGARWHELTYDGGTWMTDLPIEQWQHNRLLEPMAGDVLVGGLGLGYAANYLAARPQVDSVVVVEIAPEIVELVAPHIIDPDGKVVVIEQDLFDFLRLNDREFDWGFYDIWQSDGERTFFNVVMPLRRLSDRVNQVLCWNEDIMLGQLATDLLHRFLFTQHQMADHFPTREQLAEPKGDPYWDWSCPFFKRVLAGKINEDNVREEVRAYVLGLA